MTTFWCEHAWLGDGPAAGVRVPVDDGRIVAVQVADPAKPLFLRIVIKPKRVVSQAAPIVEEEDAPPAAATPRCHPRAW